MGDLGALCHDRKGRCIWKEILSHWRQNLTKMREDVGEEEKGRGVVSSIGVFCWKRNRVHS